MQPQMRKRATALHGEEGAEGERTDWVGSWEKDWSLLPPMPESPMSTRPFMAWRFDAIQNGQVTLKEKETSKHEATE